MLHSFAALLRAELAAAMAHRGAYVLRLLTSIMYVWIPVYFWRSVFADGARHGGFSLESVCVYAVWSSVLFAINTDYSHIFGQQIRDGRITIDLIRPYGMLTRLAAGFTAQRLAEAIRALPILVVMTIFLPFSLLPSAAVTLPFIVSVELGLGVAFGIDLTLGFLSILTINTWGLRMLRFVCMTILSGATLPLALLPDPVRRVVEYLPFQAIVAAPLTVLTGANGPNDTGVVIVGQLGWAVVATIAAVFSWRVLRSRLVVFGG